MFYKIQGQTREEKDEINYFQSPIQKEKYGIGKTKQIQLMTGNKWEKNILNKKYQKYITTTKVNMLLVI